MNNSTRVVGTLAGVILFLILINQCCFVVSEYEQAVVVQFGRPVKVVLGRQYLLPEEAAHRHEVEADLTKDYEGISISAGPGVYFKMPFLQEVAMYDGREVLYVAQAKDVVTRDKQKLLVDNYALWRIENPQRFFATVHDQQGALQRLDDLVYSVLRDELSKRDLPQIVRTTKGKLLKSEDTEFPAIDEGGRDEILANINESCQQQARQIGVRIVDVRIRRADLPEENEQAVFSRMVEERNRISRKYRAQGNSTLEQTKAETERNVKRTLSLAEKDAQITRGKADAQAAAIYAKAYSEDKDLYVFLKSLETLEKGVGAESSMIVDTEKGIFRLLKARD